MFRRSSKSAPTLSSSKTPAPRSASNSTELDNLVRALATKDGIVRYNAREALVEIGRPAVRPLITALADPNDDVRWEATKALGELRDPSSAPALVGALEDRSFGVRWLAAEALIALQRDALPPLLHALTERSSSVWLRRGAHHVLRRLAQEGLDDLIGPVLAALEDVEPVVEVPPAAWNALQQLPRTSRRRAS